SHSCSVPFSHLLYCFFCNATSPAGTYTLSLHDALPILGAPVGPDLRRRHAPDLLAVGLEEVLVEAPAVVGGDVALERRHVLGRPDRKSTRLNSSHVKISYAVFCLKKKKKINNYTIQDTK